MVDYCVVELFNSFSHFYAGSYYNELDYQDNRQVPDHPLLSWQIHLDQTEDAWPNCPSLDGEQPSRLTVAQKVPQYFMECRYEEVNQLVNVLNTKLALYLKTW